RLTDAVRHAAQAADWPLAARMVIDGLAIGEVIDPPGGPSLADEFRGMPHNGTWAEVEPNLVRAAVALSADRPESSAAALAAPDRPLARLPDDQEAAARLAAALIRLATARRAGDLATAAVAAARAEALVSQVSREPGGEPARLRHIRACVLSDRGA